MDFVNLLKNVVHVFFDQREITTSSFYDILIKLHKGYETTEGRKPHEGEGGRIYKRTQEIIRVLRFLGVLSHKGVNGDGQIHIIDTEKELNNRDLSAALAMNRSKRLVDKIKMVFRLYPKIRGDLLADEETDDLDGQP